MAQTNPMEMHGPISLQEKRWSSGIFLIYLKALNRLQYVDRMTLASSFIIIFDYSTLTS